MCLWAIALDFNFLPMPYYTLKDAYPTYTPRQPQRTRDAHKIQFTSIEANERKTKTTTTTKSGKNSFSALTLRNHASNNNKNLAIH